MYTMISIVFETKSYCVAQASLAKKKKKKMFLLLLHEY